MHFRNLVIVAVMWSFASPLLADDDDNRLVPRRGGLYFVDDDDRGEDWRERAREERKFRDEADKRARERAREWDKRERERVKELEKLDEKRREEWEKYGQERWEDQREAVQRSRDRFEHDWDDVDERQEYWRYDHAPSYHWQAPLAPRYHSRFRDHSHWHDDDFDDFDDDFHQVNPHYSTPNWPGHRHFQHESHSRWDAYEPRFHDDRRRYYVREDDDDDDDEDDGDD